ncbi:hypothetical protein PV779_58685, partial [Streptomyces sp. ID01-9D]|nr:hypothetical protein [Streptomyces sp. ID01-9D]
MAPSIELIASFSDASVFAMEARFLSLAGRGDRVRFCAGRWAGFRAGWCSGFCVMAESRWLWRYGWGESGDRCTKVRYVGRCGRARPGA